MQQHGSLALTAARPERLPKGRHSLPQEYVVASQQRRLLRAMADAVAENGYAATTVADVVARAGVSRKTFYERFDGKQECFLALYDAGIAFLQARVTDAIERLPAARPTACSRAPARSSRCSRSGPPCSARSCSSPTPPAPRWLQRRRAMMRTFAELYREINEQARAARSVDPGARRRDRARRRRRHPGARLRPRHQRRGRGSRGARRAAVGVRAAQRRGAGPAGRRPSAKETFEFLTPG